MSFCLVPEKVVEFKKALKDKSLNISELLKMSSEERTALFGKYAGDNAKDINLLFEQKLILKNKMLGIRNWASKIGEVGRYSKEGKLKFEQALEDYRLAQNERMFNPKEDQAFLSTLVEHKFGTAITKEEANNVFNFTQKVKELKSNFDEVSGKWKTPEDGIQYGASKVALENYVNELKNPKTSLGESLKGQISQFKQTENKAQAVGDVLMNALKVVNDNLISLVATVDNSFLGRQGQNTLMTHPTQWWPAAKNSFIDIVKTLGGKNAKDALMADIYSKPNYINGAYEKAKLLPKTEEQYPTSLLERIWGVGRVFKASEVAFKGSAIRMRTGLYDLMEGIAKKNGIDTADELWIKDTGKMINSVTARGEGKISGNEVTRLFLWAPKMLKGNIDVLTAHFGGAGLKTPFARKQAFINIAKIAGETVGVAVLLNAISPNSVETDPRSSDFLKFKQGNTRIDITGGKASIITLVARLLTNSTKSTVTDEVKKINTGEYGSSSMFDVGIDFLVNKTTPPVRTIIDYYRGTDANFQKTSLQGEMLNKLPISIQNFYKLKDDSSSPAIVGAFIDLIGINSNTYSNKTDWGLNTGTELQQFKDKIGEQKFNQANDEFNKQFNNWYLNVQKNNTFKNLSSDDKSRLLTKKKEEIKNQIFKQYQFKYKQQKLNKLPNL